MTFFSMWQSFKTECMIWDVSIFGNNVSHCSETQVCEHSETLQKHTVYHAILTHCVWDILIRSECLRVSDILWLKTKHNVCLHIVAYWTGLQSPAHTAAHSVYCRVLLWACSSEQQQVIVVRLCMIKLRRSTNCFVLSPTLIWLLCLTCLFWCDYTSFCKAPS